jgi:hypothetical protein
MCDVTSRNRGYAQWVAVGLLVAAPCAWAQQSSPPPAPAHDALRPDELEPGVNTSATPPPVPSAPAPAASAPSRAASPPTQSAGSAATVSGSGDNSRPKAGKSGARGSASARPKADNPGTDTQAAGGPAPATGEAPAPAQAANSGGKGGKAQDHLQLDTTQITGNQELPKVLYIVPWKRSDLGDLLGKPANSLLDEVLEPVDRDVFKRENRYYDALKPDGAAGADKAGGAAGQGSADNASGDRR